MSFSVTIFLVVTLGVTYVVLLFMTCKKDLYRNRVFRRTRRNDFARQLRNMIEEEEVLRNLSELEIKDKQKEDVDWKQEGF